MDANNMEVIQESIINASDEEVMKISDRLFSENKDAYEVLAQ